MVFHYLYSLILVFKESKLNHIYLFPQKICKRECNTTNTRTKIISRGWIQVSEFRLIVSVHFRNSWRIAMICLLVSFCCVSMGTTNRSNEVSIAWIAFFRWCSLSSLRFESIVDLIEKLRRNKIMVHYILIAVFYRKKKNKRR